jgi:hypothetical protein
MCLFLKNVFIQTQKGIKIIRKKYIRRGLTTSIVEPV